MTNGSSADEIVVRGSNAALFAANTRAALEAIESSLLQAVSIWTISIQNADHTCSHLVCCAGHTHCFYWIVHCVVKFLCCISGNLACDCIDCSVCDGLYTLQVMAFFGTLEFRLQAQQHELFEKVNIILQV